MIRLQGVWRSYGAHEVLRGVDWGVATAARVGLVGPNGAGKTTLLKILAGLEEPDRGVRDVPRGITLGFLPQEGARLPEGSVLDALLEPFAEVAAMEVELERLHRGMAESTGEELESLTRLSGDLQHRFEAAGGFELEFRAKTILGGLGFGPQDAARPLREFSGGFRMRAALGSLLLKNPDVLLLDEPTNHLDLDGVAWLESFLANSRSSLVIVSHDRTFLNRLVSSIAEVEQGRVRVWAGNYDRYRVLREAERERALKKAASEAHRVEDIERFIERFRYKATKARQVQSRIKMLEKMERTEVLAEDPSWRFSFPGVNRSASRVAVLSGIHKGYGGRSVLRGIDLEIFRGDRIALVGPNGCGKSTLLQVVAGRQKSDEGTLEIGEKVILHYFAQHVLETLTSGRTVLEEMQSWAPNRGAGQLRSLLGIFQFSGDEVFKKVEVLSGGEKNRLALARLTLDPGNFLILDEPTNHLDLPTREALESALAGFGGTLLFVSHDRYFINRVATRVAAFREGRIALFQGGYDDYLSASRMESPPSSVPTKTPAKPRERDPAPRGGAGAASSAPSREAGRERRRQEAEARNRKSRELRVFRERIARAEAEILPLEKRRKEIEEALVSADTYRDPARARHLGEERKRIEVDLAHLYDEWDEATSDLQREEAPPHNTEPPARAPE
ncbi:MAG TPA: ATP-binding cassette domain-containing protein [Candidatus Polarisedimenticolia bacterium]|nr:ATP-binding cassette domain-containing protein [Candidatus Polarisedimenticolia bacterium]